MGLETATYLASLVATNPTGGDLKNAGDNHVRLLKAVLQATFPGFSGAALGTHLDIRKGNYAATAAPTANEDALDGYHVGSLWLDTTADIAYVCLNNSTGAAVWQQISQGQAPIATVSYVIAYLNADQSISNAAGVTVGAGAAAFTEVADLGSNFDAATGVFTAPSTRLYQIDWRASLLTVSTNPTEVFFSYLSNEIENAIYALGNTCDGSSGTDPQLTSVGSCIQPLTAGDTVKLMVHHETGGTRSLAGSLSLTDIRIINLN